MDEKKLKYKDMIIAIFCTVLTVLCIVFYFLPAFNIRHTLGGMNPTETVTYSAFEMTLATFTTQKILGYNWTGLLFIKDVYGVALILSGILMPLAIICAITTTVFAYLSWLKSDKLKKFCFLFGLLCMIFQTITLICTWFIAIMTREGNSYNYFNANIKGGMSYGSFVSLILAFVIAIIACAYNYFIDDGRVDPDEEEEEDEEDEEEEEDEDEEEEEEEEEPTPKQKRRWGRKAVVEEEDVEEKEAKDTGAKETEAVEPVKKTSPRKRKAKN